MRLETWHVASAGHWTNGGTGITNFPSAELPAYTEAVKRFGDGLRVDTKPMHGGIESDGSLHFTGKRFDTGGFFALLKQVRAELA